MIAIFGAIGAIFFIAAGTVSVFWPDRLRDWSLNTSRFRPLPMERLMFTKGYLVSFRVGGAISVLVGIALLGFLVWGR
jgi:hypothetical protein